MKNFDIKEVVDYLSSEATLTTLLATVTYGVDTVPAIYRNLPESENIDGIYFMVSETLDTLNGTLDNVTTMEVRILAGNEKITYSQIKAVDNKIKDLLIVKFDYNSFEVYNTVVKSGRELLNEKDRKEYVRDYDLYFLT
jgi:hypothetical protein